MMAAMLLKVETQEQELMELMVEKLVKEQLLKMVLAQ
jgi:hypothetical protein